MQNKGSWFKIWDREDMQNKGSGFKIQDSQDMQNKGSGFKIYYRKDMQTEEAGFGSQLYCWLVVIQFKKSVISSKAPFELN